MPAPTVSDAETYLASTGSTWDTAEVTKAFNAEKKAQANACVVPTARDVEVTTTLDSAIVTSDEGFSSDDEGSEITGTGIPAGATIVTYTDSSTVTISENATATGTVTASVEEYWDEDLVEALFRRIAHNLAVRSLPLGFQATITDIGSTSNKVGGWDAEVRRLETPYRKVTFG